VVVIDVEQARKKKAYFAVFLFFISKIKKVNLLVSHAVSSAHKRFMIHKNLNI